MPKRRRQLGQVTLMHQGYKMPRDPWEIDLVQIEATVFLHQQSSKAAYKVRSTNLPMDFLAQAPFRKMLTNNVHQGTRNPTKAVLTRVSTTLKKWETELIADNTHHLCMKRIYRMGIALCHRMERSRRAGLAVSLKTKRRTRKDWKTQGTTRIWVHTIVWLKMDH